MSASPSSRKISVSIALYAGAVTSYALSETTPKHLAAAALAAVGLHEFRLQSGLYVLPDVIFSGS